MTLPSTVIQQVCVPADRAIARYGRRTPPVIDVRFSANDVARTRFSATPPPLQEAALALAALRRAGASRADGQHASSPHR
jgi:hypothetical protein